jgi:hypothetical protein
VDRGPCVSRSALRVAPINYQTSTINSLRLNKCQPIPGPAGG